MKEEKQFALAHAKIPKLIVSYSLMTLSALLLHSVYSLTDALFVSWGVGADAMGGISVAFPFVMLQSAIGAALGGGAAAVVSKKLGEKNPASGGAAALNAMVAFWVTALFTTALGLIFLKPLLTAFGATAELYESAREYLTVILIGNIFSTGFSAIIRAEGKMLYGMLIWVIPVSLNILLDAVFILGFSWGVTGSAWATVISQFVSFSMAIVFFLKFSALQFKGAKLRFKTLGEILSLGLPALVQQSGMAVWLIILNNVLKDTGGSPAITAYAYVHKLILFALMAFTAIAQVLMPVAGYNYGAGNPERVKKSLSFSLLLAAVYAVLIITVLEAIPGLLLKAFTNDPEIIALAVTALRISAAALLFMPLPMILGAFYQAQGKRVIVWILYGANLVYYIPSAYLFALLFGLSGAWWAFPFANALSFVTGLIILLFNKKHKSTPIL